MTKFRLSPLVAVGVLAGGLATSASAADLGGNCCADLEERIAELEATTARKGNRKVSLTITGFVAQQLLFWDDGVESNVYITDLGSTTLGSHVKFTGQAAIAPGWSAGYTINLEAVQNDSLAASQDRDNGLFPNAQSIVANGAASPIDIESSFWFVKSDQYGKVSLGKQSSAADNQAILVDASGSLITANYVLYDVNAFGIRLRNSATGAYIPGSSGAGGLTWGNFASCATLDGGGGVSGDCDGYPNNNIRYDTPVFGGFSASFSWGEDDDWAVSGRYSGEGYGFKFNAAVAYNENSDENGPGGLSHVALSAQAVQIGAYIEHVATGLFVYGDYSREFIDQLSFLDTAGVFQNASNKPEGDQWYIKGGIRTRLNPLGHTVLYGNYGQNNNRQDARAFIAGYTNTQHDDYGVGVVQEVDAAAMALWIAWKHEALSAVYQGTAIQSEDLDIVKAGAIINF